MNTKQVIVFRRDLLKGERGIRKGKFGAQVAHASMGALLSMFDKRKSVPFSLNGDGTVAYDEAQPHYEYSTVFGAGSVLDDWLNGKFTKVVLGCENEEELKEIKKACDAVGIPNALITDCGLTEFNGVPTVTCLGIGPYLSEGIDNITGNLKCL